MTQQGWADQLGTKSPPSVIPKETGFLCVRATGHLPAMAVSRALRAPTSGRDGYCPHRQTGKPRRREDSHLPKATRGGANFLRPSPSVCPACETQTRVSLWACRRPEPPRGLRRDPPHGPRCGQRQGQVTAGTRTCTHTRPGAHTLGARTLVGPTRAHIRTGSNARTRARPAPPPRRRPGSGRHLLVGVGIPGAARFWNLGSGWGALCCAGKHSLWTCPGLRPSPPPGAGWGARPCTSCCWSPQRPEENLTRAASEAAQGAQGTPGSWDLQTWQGLREARGGRWRLAGPDAGYPAIPKFSMAVPGPPFL